MLSGVARLSHVSQSVLAAEVDARRPPRGSAGGEGGKRRTENARVVGLEVMLCRLCLAVASVRCLIMVDGVWLWSRVG